MKEIVVALSGTLETFSLPDVLRLLSSTKKTGLLALDGDRGRGRIWVREGAVVAADADRAVNEQVEGVAFELLRFADATFEFDSGAEAPEGDGHEVDAVLAEAEARLAEWREIEAVVPSLDVWVRMVAELDGERSVSTTQWRVLAQVGTGTSGHTLADRLDQGEYDVCRQLRDLVEDGMVELDEAPAAADAPVEVRPVLGVDVDAAWDAAPEPTFAEPALAPETVSHLGADLASFVAAGTVEEAVPVDFAEPEPAFDEPESWTDEPDEPVEATSSTFDAMVDTGTADPAPAAEVEESDEPADLQPSDEAEVADEGDFLSQLSQLSPKAAAAVEATWGGDETAPVDEEPAEAPVAEAPVAEAPAAPAGDDIDQNLLLRFLSSAKG